MLTNEKSWLVRLFLISFAALFLEVLFIRWIASEIRIFGYFKNMILIAAVVGLGIGCALGGRSTGSKGADNPDESNGNKKEREPQDPDESNGSKKDRATAEQGSGKAISSQEETRLDACVFPFLVMILSGVLAFSTHMELTHMSFLFTLDVFVWDQIVPSIAALIKNVIVILLIFMLVVIIFDMLGQKLGRELADRPPLVAYSVNLAGSLMGVLAYTLLCYMETSPWLWLTVTFVALLPFWRRPEHLALFAVSIGLAVYATFGSHWSPYYRIDLDPFFFKKDGVTIKVGTHVEVNHDYHQKTLNFNKKFLDEHPSILKSKDFQIYYNTYNFPYEVAPSLKRVLVLGAGSGNDVAAALRHGAQRVDAVEIDPAILRYGKTIHPENPYADSRVFRHNDDARAYLSNDRSKYDVIVFGHVDSHTTFSTLSSVRLDNYLYTKESIESATGHLSEKGLAALSFAAGPQWLRARLYQVVKAVANSDPIILKTHFDNPGSITILWGPGLDDIRSRVMELRKDAIIATEEVSRPIELPTDDWPFLYQQLRNIPPIYLTMLVVLFLVSSLIIFTRMRLSLGSLVQYSQFFFLGAGFLLMETRAMLAISILFGSTWIVNSIVIAVVLLMALAANWLVMRVSTIKQWHGYVALLISLVIMYMVPLAQFSGESVTMKLLVSALVLGLPFAFSGIVFSRALSRVTEPERALGINILGALLGGCLEYLSTVVGSNGLTMLALAVYVISLLVALSPAAKRK